ncbi:6-bladed beta-propeller [candidate division KSB1 bacterium]
MRSTLIMLPAFLILLLILSCSSGEKTYTEETVNGIRNIHNLSPKWGDEPKIGLEFHLKLGDVESDDDNYNFYRAFQVKMDRSGNYYILDSGNNRIQKLDPDGKYLLTIGNKGQGPGEFESISSIDIGGSELLYVNDNGTMDVFDLEGELINSIRLERNTPHIVVLDSDRLLLQYYTIVRPGDDEDVDNQLLFITDKNGAIQKRIGYYTKTENHTLSAFINLSFPVISNEGSIYIDFVYQNRIDKFSPEGIQELRFDRPLNFEVENKMGERTLEAGGREFKVPFPDMTDVSDFIGIDNKERLWISTYTSLSEKDEEGKVTQTGDRILEIFDDEGILLYRLEYPEGCSRFRGVENDKVFFTDDDEVTFNVYKIVEY